MRDLDEDGSLDNPGDILYHVPTRTGQKDNYSIGIGFSATWSRPLDKETTQCKTAAASNIEMMQQLTANKRLDFEIARLKNCGNLLKEGIRFTPGTKYAAICADVQVSNVNLLQNHTHSIPAPSKSESPYSSDAADLGGTLQTQSESSSREESQSSSSPSSQSFQHFQKQIGKRFCEQCRSRCNDSNRCSRSHSTSTRDIAYNLIRDS